MIEKTKVLSKREKRKKTGIKAAPEGEKESTASVIPIQPTTVEDPSRKEKKKKRFEKIKAEEKISVDTEKVGEYDESEAQKNSVSLVQEDFTILGKSKQKKSKVAKRVLPQWLLHPEIVSADLNNGLPLENITENILDSRFIEKLKLDGFSKLFPIQTTVLSWLLQCDSERKRGLWLRDTCVSMPTGSGKTLTYVLPIIKILETRLVRLVRCLIVLPVQELANQVYDVVEKYSSCTSLRVALISGASSFQQEQEKLVQEVSTEEFASKVDIVVATPGRLIDHIKKTKGFSLSYLRFLVIDEADRSVDWLQYIPVPHSKSLTPLVSNMRSSSNIPAQKILLSATLSQDPEKLSRLGLFRPILFTSAVVDFENLDRDINLDKDLFSSNNTYGNPSELKERIVECSLQEKPLAVYKLLMSDQGVEKSLVFTNSADAAHRLAILLQSMLKVKNITVGELSAHLGSKQREETLEKFIQGSLQVLVSSDALARGIDVPGIKLVVSYDLPKHVKGYIHRAGRTGRGGILGTAVSLLQPNQTALFKSMLSRVGKSVPEIEKEDLEDVAESANYERHLEHLKTILSHEQQEALQKIKSRKRRKKM